MFGNPTEGTVTNIFTAPYGTPPTSKPQTQRKNVCLTGLCTPGATPPTQLIQTGSKGSIATSVIPTGGIGVYVQPAGDVLAPNALNTHNSLPSYRPVKGA